MADEVILVTGITGFIGCHVAKDLIDKHYRVKGTVRSLSSPKINQLQELFKKSKFPLELVEADLTKDDGWDDAMSGCTVLMHVASPFPNIAEHTVIEDNVVKPAIEGTMRAIKAAVKAKIKKIVLTSSAAAIFAGTDYDRVRTFTEEDWADSESSTIDVYSKSKILAEKAAWDYLKELPDDEKFELFVINPAFVLGPVLLECHKNATSVNFMIQIMNKVYPGHPKLSINYCDVRDVAAAHRKVLKIPEASGKRHIIRSEGMWMKDIAIVAAEEFGPKGYSIAVAEIPYFLCWIAGIFNKGMRTYILPRYGKIFFTLSHERMTYLLGIRALPMKTTIIDMVTTLIKLGLLKKPKKIKQGEAPVENAEDVAPIENAEDVAPVENAEDVAPAENAEDVAPAENAEDVAPAENAKDVAPAENAKDVAPAENAKDVAPAENAKDVAPAEKTEVVKE